MKRYVEMPTLSKHEKIVRTNEGRRQKNNYLTGIQRGPTSLLIGWINYFAEDYNFFYMCCVL